MRGEKSKYKTFGNSEIETMYGTFKKFGQEMSLYDDEAFDVIQHGGIVRAEDFDAIGWTPLEKSNRNERTPKNLHFMECHQAALVKRQELIDALTARLAKMPEASASDIQSDNF